MEMSRSCPSVFQILTEELLEQSDENVRSSPSGGPGGRLWRVGVLLCGLALVVAAVWSVGRSKVRSVSRHLVAGCGRVQRVQGSVWVQGLNGRNM